MAILTFFILNLLSFSVNSLAYEQNLREGLDQLNTRLTNQFDLHSKIEYVQQGISQHVKGRLRTRSDNFQKLTDETGRKLDKFFQQKISALKKIVEGAEKEINGLSYDEQLVNGDEDCENYLQKINTLNLYNTPIDEKVNRSGIHITIESYKCDNSVVRDLEWSGMDGIEKSFMENSKNDKYLLRQYIGTYSGLSRVYPAFPWETEPLLSVDLFDPRFRPWFFGAVSAPKDILFLLDYSGSVKGQNLHLMKINIMHILSTLTPNDYFNAVWYNSKQAFLLEPCSEDRFIAATTRNKRLFHDFLGKIEEHDQASLPPAMNLTLNKFLSDEYIGSTRQNQTSGGHQLIFLFTDGIEFWPTEEIKQYKVENPQKPIRVFGFAVGRGTGDIRALHWTSCEMGGTSTNIETISDLKAQSRLHLSKLSEPLANALKSRPVSKRPVSFSFPYMDAQNEGAILSISAPILNKMFTLNGTVGPDENNNFIGVAGVDLSLERLRLMLPSNTEQLKSFIIDNNGIVFYHQKLKLPAREVFQIRRTACYIAPLKHKTGSRVQFGPVDERIRRLMGHVDSIPTLDILEIETNFTSKFAAFRNAMVRGDCGKMIDDGDKQYKCVRIANTPLTVGFVFYKNKRVLELDERVEKMAYEESELIGEWVREPSLCSEFLSADGELDRFESLIDMAEKRSECLTQTNQAMLLTFSRSVNEWRSSWPLLEENITCQVNPRPDSFHDLYRTSFVEYVPGIVSFYPKCEFSSVQQFFYNRPQILDGNAENQYVKIHIDPLTQITTLYRAIFDSTTEKQIALVGAQFGPKFISTIWSDLFKKSENWQFCRNSKGRCYIVTNEAYIVGSSDSRVSVTHLASKEPVLFDQLIAMNAIKSFTQLDYQSKCQIGPRFDQAIVNTPISSAIRYNPIQLIKNFGKLAYSWFTFDLFFHIEQIKGETKEESTLEDCQFHVPELNEQCVMKYPIYEIQVNKTTTIQFKPKKNCDGSTTIIPSTNNQLFAFVVETNCQSTQKEVRGSSEAISKHPFKPTRIPECNLVKRRVRYRLSNIDYNVTYPEEKKPECSATNPMFSINQRTTVIFYTNLILLLPRIFE